MEHDIGVETGEQGIIFLASETRIGRAGLVCGQYDVAPADSDKENRSEDHGEGLASNRSYRRLAQHAR